MSTYMQTSSRWLGRVAAGAILLLGMFWTGFGLACAWGHPCVLMHIMIPGLPMVVLGLLSWRLPAFGGVVLTLWGASPLLSLIGGRPFFRYPGQWLSMTPILVYWLPLLLGIVMIVAGVVERKRIVLAE